MAMGKELVRRGKGREEGDEEKNTAQKNQPIRTLNHEGDVSAKERGIGRMKREGMM